MSQDGRMPRLARLCPHGFLVDPLDRRSRPEYSRYCPDCEPALGTKARTEEWRLTYGYGFLIRKVVRVNGLTHRYGRDDLESDVRAHVFGRPKSGPPHLEQIIAGLNRCADDRARERYLWRTFANALHKRQSRDPEGPVLDSQHYIDVDDDGAFVLRDRDAFDRERVDLAEPDAAATAVGEKVAERRLLFAAASENARRDNAAVLEQMARRDGIEAGRRAADPGLLKLVDMVRGQRADNHGIVKRDGQSIEAAVNGLPEPQRGIILLRWLHERLFPQMLEKVIGVCPQAELDAWLGGDHLTPLPRAEVAALLGLSEKQVRNSEAAGLKELGIRFRGMAAGRRP